jgi:D-alanine-D-alanine ligase
MANFMFAENKTESVGLSGADKPELILVIYSVIESLARGEARDLITDMETVSIAQAITDGLASLQYKAQMAPIRTLDDVAANIAELDPDATLVFNLCEALGGVSGLEAEVPRLLERFGFCYVGADANNLDACLDKGHAKAYLLEHGIPTAPYQILYTGHEPVHVPLPAIVKPLHEDCSIGLSPQSMVCDEEALRRQAAYILRTYQQPALVEMFLDGREFLVSLWGNDPPQALAIAQVDYSNSPDPRFAFDHFEAKWNDTYSTLLPAPVDRATYERICQIALAAYGVMGCRDYARVDMREKDGMLYVLEVNPNPGLAPTSGFAKAARLAGYTYAQMTRQLARLAWERRKKN